MLDKRVEEYWAKKEEKERIVKLIKQKNDLEALRLSEELSEEFKEAEDYKLAYEYQIKAGLNGYYLPSDYHVRKFKNKYNYIEDALNKAMNFAKTDGIKTEKDPIKKLIYFTYVPKTEKIANNEICTLKKE